MASDNQVEVDRVIRFVLGDLNDWKRPEVLKSVGKNYPELFDAFETELAELREAIRQILEARYSAEELAFEFPDSCPSSNDLEQPG